MAARCAGWCATTPRPALTAWSCGSTGEAALDDAEQLAVLDAVLNVADGLPVMMDPGNHQGHVLRRLSAFGTRPLAASWRRAVLRAARTAARPPISLPADASPGAGAVRHSSTAPARRWTRPRCGAGGAPEHRRHQDCGGSLEKTVALIADGRLRWRARICRRCRPCAWVVPASSRRAHIRPDLFVALYRAVREQRLDQARALFLALAPMIQLAFAEPNPDRQGSWRAGPADRRAGRAHAGGQRAGGPPGRRWPSWTVRFRRVERGAGARPRGWGVRQALSASFIW